MYNTPNSFYIIHLAHQETRAPECILKGVCAGLAYFKAVRRRVFELSVCPLYHTLDKELRSSYRSSFRISSYVVSVTLMPLQAAITLAWRSEVTVGG